MTDLGNKKIMARNIIRLMELNKVDRNDVSKALNVPYTTVSDWINGKTYPRIDKIEMLANYFGVPKSELVEEKSNNLDYIYYINKDTAVLVEQIYKNDHILFDVYKSPQRDKLMAYAKFLEEERKREEGL